jgi:ribosomal protein S18 acetylase RimI-like enzyme
MHSPNNQKGFLPMQFVDKALARRLESAEEMPQVDCALMLQKLRPEIGAAYEPFGGGHMIFAGLNSPIGHAAGFGFEAAITAADLDSLEAFYKSHDAPAQLDLCPLTDPSVLELVSKRHYALAELNNVLYCALNSAISTDVPPDVHIRRGKAEEAALFSQIVARSFFDNSGPPDGFADMLSPLFAFPEALTYLALVDGTPVAAAAGRIIPEHRICALFGAGTLPEFRNRGIQTALLRTRLKAASQAGCEYAVVITRGGTISERNCLRLGFRIAYSKATVIRHWSSA